jgi:folylpolyglutamate synthase
LNIIHVAGTKGKGSTCAFTRSFLRAHGLRTGFPRKIGLYTSPDLRCIRERIQINDQPVMEDMFTQYFFEVWERLASQDSNTTVENTRQPRYLQLLALVAFHTFIREQVDAAIFETHHGGEYDATNVIPQPVATAITSIGMDHIAQLGPTIEDIAWHKAGIFKPGAPAFSAAQDPGPTSVIRSRATEKGVDLTFVSVDQSLPVNVPALSVPAQRVNCSLALAVARAFLQRKSPGDHLSQDDILQGVEKFSWPGRFEIINEGSCQWFLDGAHNELSVEQAAEWFAKNTSQRQKYVGFTILVSPRKLIIYSFCPVLVF